MPLFVKFIKPLSDKDGRLDKKKKKGAGFVGFIFSWNCMGPTLASTKDFWEVLLGVKTREARMH